MPWGIGLKEIPIKQKLLYSSMKMQTRELSTMYMTLPPGLAFSLFQHDLSVGRLLENFHCKITSVIIFSGPQKQKIVSFVDLEQFDSQI